MSSLPTRPFAGLPITVSTPDEAAEFLCRTSRVGQGCDVHLANAYTVALADRTPELRAVLQCAGINFPDGRPLAILTKGSAQPLRQIRGPKLFEDVMSVGRESGVTHFLLGTTDETLQRLKASLESRYPGVAIVGMHAPPFRPLTDEELATQDRLIRDSGAAIVWVGLGTPKQDFEVQRLAQSLSVVAVAVGAAFDFSAGMKPTAPSWMTKIGLEWIFRLASEPRRLWRRYLFGNMDFMLTVWRHRGRT